jgi:hypothetical protein
MNETIKVTYERFLEIYALLRNVDIKAEDKFQLVVIDLVEEYKQIYKDYNNKVKRINLQYAFEDPTTKIVHRESFTKENEIKREDALNELNERLVDIPVCPIDLTPELKQRLNPYSIFLLKGILFADEIKS